MKSKDVMLKYNICRQTLYRWRRDGLIEYQQTPTNRYIYGIRKDYERREVTIPKTIIYARVSTSGQKDNLERQIKRLKQFASANGMIVDDVYSEIASALNYNRKKFNKLLDLIFEKKVDTILIEYKDRMVRVGYEHFENICKKFGVKIVVADNSDDKSKDKQKEIINDLVSIMHHFSAKIYSLRKNKKQIEALVKC